MIERHYTTHEIADLFALNPETIRREARAGIFASSGSGRTSGLLSRLYASGRSQSRARCVSNIRQRGNTRINCAWPRSLRGRSRRRIAEELVLKLKLQRAAGDVHVEAAPTLGDNRRGARADPRINRTITNDRVL